MEKILPILPYVRPLMPDVHSLPALREKLYIAGQFTLCVGVTLGVFASVAGESWHDNGTVLFLVGGVLLSGVWGASYPVEWMNRQVSLSAREKLPPV